LNPRTHPHRSRLFSVPIRIYLVSTPVHLLAGCASVQKRAPSIDVFGSYFPAWLISLVAGVVLTVVAGAAGHLINFKASGFLAFLLNVSLILIFSISIWFWFFAG
jgi:hypothetical protein